MKLEDTQNSSSYTACLAEESMDCFFMLFPCKGGGYCTLCCDVKHLRKKEVLYHVLRVFTNHFDSFPSLLMTGVPLIPLRSSTVYNLAYAL